MVGKWGRSDLLQLSSKKVPCVFTDGSDYIRNTDIDGVELQLV